MDELRDDFKVGFEIATLLQSWRPTMSPEEIASALMHSLERYSIEVEGPSESGLSACMSLLKKLIDERRMSI